MGNWQLEVAKMAMYVSFPVFTFFVFNHPPFYEKLMKGNAGIFGQRMPVDPEVIRLAEERKERYERRQQKKWLAQQRLMEQEESQ